MTNIDTQNSGNFNVYLDYIFKPSTIASSTGTITWSGNDLDAIFLMSYTGAKQSGVPDDSDVQEVGGTDLSFDAITTVADNCFIVGVVRDNQGQTSTPNGIAVELYDSADTNGFWFADTLAITPPGTQTFGRTRASGVSSQGGVCASFAPDGVAGSGFLSALAW